MKFIVCFVTCSSVDEAKKIIDILLAKKLIACANLVADVQSFFLWKGNKDQANECLVIMKSTENFFDQISNTVREYHQYEIPEIIYFPIRGEINYMDWIKSEATGTSN